MDVAAHKKRLMIILVGSVAFVGVVIAVAVLATQENDNEQEPATASERAKRALDRMPVIDGHNDFPWSLRKIVFNDLRRVNFNSDLRLDPNWAGYRDSATDLPRLREGRVGAQFWVAYCECPSQYTDAVEQTIEQIDIIKRLVANYSDDLVFASSSADIEKAIEDKKIASLVAVESGHSIQSSFGILRTLYELGARYMTLTHNCNTPWADAAPVDKVINNTLQPASNGLSAFGLEIIDEMNRLGMMVDLSHVSVATQKAAIARSKAPIIFSHSSAFKKCPHHRNVHDDVLQLVKSNDGIVMVNFYRHFIQCDSTVNATLQDVIDHIEHIKETAGIDHVGIGGDYDGIDETPIGLEDVSKYPVLFEALAKTWTVEELEKLAGRNLLRVFKAVEKVRDQLKDEPPKQGNIKKSEILKVGLNTTCITAPFENETAVAEEKSRRRRDVPEELDEDEYITSTL